MGDLLRILALLALVAGNAFFVIGEYAVVTARRGALRQRADAGSAGARAALRLMAEPVRVISTVQVGITAIGILTGAIGEPLVRELLGDAIPGWAGFLIAFGVVTYLSVVLGELVPKALTLDRAEALAVAVARPIGALSVAFAPIVWVLQGSAQILLRPFGVREVMAGETIRTPEDLRELVDEAEGSGVIEPAQEELLHNVFDFAGRRAGDVMAPAPEVVWLDWSLPAREALARVAEQPYSRYPVGRGSLDRAVGAIHIREIVAAARSEPGAPVGPRAQPAPVVPESKDLGALLRELRERRRHLAIVADEYGGTAGIVTLEDVLEEIVGEIEDEYDRPAAALERVDEHTVRIPGGMAIEDFDAAAGTRLPRDGPRTMAGLVLNALGRRPRAGDTVTVAGTELIVDEVDALRITRLRVRPGPDG